MRKFFKISLTLNKNGFRWFEVEWDCEEKNTIYKLTRKYDDGEKITRHLKKEDLFVIGNNIITTPSCIEFSIVTPAERVEEAKKLLMEKVIKEANYFKSEIYILLSHIK